MVFSTHHASSEEPRSVPYRATVDVPHELVEHVFWLIYARRCERRSRWRKPGCFQQALLALVHLRTNEPPPALAAGFGISTATAWRYLDETLDVLAAWASGLHEALTGLGEGDFVIVDGTLIPIDRIAADESYYSMKHRKHRKHGMNVQVIARPDGTPLWFSRATPGRTHDNTAARHDHILARLRAAGLGALADLGFRGLDNDVLAPVIVTGFHASRTHKLTPGQKTANRVLAVGRAPVEHGFAHLKNWRTLTKLRTDPARATGLLRALLVLTNLEVSR
ncbi:transposase family protein [Streptomyces sp. NPDC058664]|uniref:transposase family protein n=1 Tax=unclassified Streptomyces TaxID=2593676 RepID=UPI003668AE1C